VVQKSYQTCVGHMLMKLKLVRGKCAYL
jgi:hypothetical protein